MMADIALIIDIYDKFEDMDIFKKLSKCDEGSAPISLFTIGRVFPLGRYGR